MRYRLTDECLALANSGYRGSQIAEMFGVSKEAVNQYLRRRGFVRRKKEAPEPVRDVALPLASEFFNHARECF